MSKQLHTILAENVEKKLLGAGYSLHDSSTDHEKHYVHPERNGSISVEQGRAKTKKYVFSGNTQFEAKNIDMAIDHHSRTQSKC